MSGSIGREHKRSDGRLPIIELFGPTIQGEGQLCGSQSHFIRFGGCDYRCSWCDSMHAVDPDAVHRNATWLSPSEITIAIQTLPFCPTVTFSGGNPALWDLTELIDRMRSKHYLNIETQGSIWAEWMLNLDLITVSPKGPSSGMYPQLDWDLLRHFYSIDGHIQNEDNPYKMLDVVFKVVVFNNEDFEFARRVRAELDEATLYLSSGSPLPEEGTMIDLPSEILYKYRWLCELVLQTPDMCNVTVLPQVHQLIWPGQHGK